MLFVFGVSLVLKQLVKSFRKNEIDFNFTVHYYRNIRKNERPIFFRFIQVLHFLYVVFFLSVITFLIYYGL